MLSRITGKILEFSENSVILDLHGLGFEILLPTAILKTLENKMEEPVTLVLYFYLQITPSRGTPVLIGFNTELEREFFEHFISIASIGPKTAVKSLIYPFSQIARAIDTGDESLLKSMPGIGPRKVKEIIAKLQGKLSKFVVLEEGEEVISDRRPVFIPTDIKNETLEVLLQLQYTKTEALKKIEKVLHINPDLKSSEELINLVLKEGR
ncbi:MAG TPA: OB-fold domain-containing protein [Candidatus Eremiobacteraeota bacterium]|nr:MAG: Holliday junction ATP-dependent DNA helicase RuvA [bacterium ADurb.Bin363]HPZ07526.1 OB-fold domain-containing protein [Candidatus Eremiobacteraeota bacterium]